MATHIDTNTWKMDWKNKFTRFQYTTWGYACREWSWSQFISREIIIIFLVQSGGYPFLRFDWQFLIDLW